MSKKKMTQAEKDAFKERMAAARGNKKPTAKKTKPARNAQDVEIETVAKTVVKKTERTSSLPDPDPEGKYPKVEFGTWEKRKKRFAKLVDDGFKKKQAQKPREHAGESEHKTRIESAKPSKVTL